MFKMQSIFDKVYRNRVSNILITENNLQWIVDRMTILIKS
jgi:hypothetical protein